MSRSVSAPSSVTNTSPCWNGLIVPGSTFRYGSNFWSWTRSPRAFSRRPSEAATIPFPSAETTPPVTKTYFGARALTGFQGSTPSGGRLLGSWTDEYSELRQRQRGERATDPADPGPLDEERRCRLAVLVRFELELGVDSGLVQVEGEPALWHDVEDQQGPAELRTTPEEAHAVRPLDLPERAGGDRAPNGRFDVVDPGPPVGEPRRIGENRPHVLDGPRQRAPSRVPRQGTPARRASARARPSAPRHRAARCAYASGHPRSSRHGSGGRRARRSGEDG